MMQGDTDLALRNMSLIDKVFVTEIAVSGLHKEKNTPCMY